jgi:hypothetical protein
MISPPVEENAMIGTKPYAKLKYREVKGRQMAYIDEGEGDGTFKRRSAEDK